ncbi:MAG: Unknown protein [uncultured Sulfurovum sp.]|uniref:Uncharacterized protein n=1 Tax=uncultured Sulfurovum sp. TaxID=269237 RepID=A0A6S6SEL0_9BACT|nr:MAG: Unknown protein [uncultured Sulfurovum sp.]
MHKSQILVAVISMNSESLKNLFSSFQKSHITDKVEINFMVFMNSLSYQKPILKNFDTKIKYLPLSSDKHLDISMARTFLQEEVFLFCKKSHIEPIVWFLDEDMEVDQRVNEYLPSLHTYKNQYDVLIGSIEGDSPNASFSGINVQLLDLIHNLIYLDSLNDNDFFPNHEKENQILREKYPDYYYDLSSRHTQHLQEVFYIIPLSSKEKVSDVRNRIYSNLKNIISGQNIFRPIIQEKISTYSDTLLRGGNTFVLNLDTLKVKNPSIRINNQILRRSDMLWALTNKEFLRQKIVKTDFIVLHNRRFDIEKELNIEKTVAENRGSIVFNALKQYYEDKERTGFRLILKKNISTKKESIEKNFLMIQKNIQRLKKLKNTHLDMFVENLEKFYNQTNINHILKNIELLNENHQDVFNQFISYKPLILGSAILETLDNNFIQYDIGNDDIKMITKTPIEDINKDRAVVRIHSSCANSEVFGAIDCDCAEQLKESMNLISEIDNGILFYITQEGRGHGYGKKIAIVNNMQTKNVDTYEACNLLGLEDDIRDYSEIAKIINSLGIKSIEIASNNPRKRESLEKEGIKVSIKKEKLVTLYTHENIEYLISKQKKGKHEIVLLDKKILIERYPYLEDKVVFYQKYDSYGGFSNFSDYPFHLQDKYWRTSEHYYQAHKFRRNSDIFNRIQGAKTATESKEIAYSCTTYYDDWENRKILFMHNALISKFRQNEILKEELLSTGKSYIVENAVDDDYWGCGSDGKGHNILGRLLMYVRDELSEKAYY